MNSKEDFSLLENDNKKVTPFPFQVSTTCPRQLTDEEKVKLDKDKDVVSDFKQNKLEIEAKKNWDLFYKRNTTKFFKDRHWTKREFSDLVYKDGKQTDQRRVVLEVGCGVGNFIFPLLEEFNNLFFYACDFSKRAVQFVKENDLYDTDRCHAFQCDITCDDLTNEIPVNSVDIVSMIFVLSAIHPDKMVMALQNICKVLKPGGCLLFRDYGLYDHAMLRFAPGHKLSDNFYVRQDGTRAYYFRTDELSGLMEEAGYTCSQCEYVQRETINKKEGLCVPRIFVQAKFIKPGGDTHSESHCLKRLEQCSIDEETKKNTKLSDETSLADDDKGGNSENLTHSSMGHNLSVQTETKCEVNS